MAAAKTDYISNPLKMISPSASALGVNIGTLLSMLGLQLAPFILVLIALPIGFLGRGSTIALIFAFTLGFVATIAFIVLGLFGLPTYSIILLASVQGKKINLKSALNQAKPFVLPSLAMAILLVLAVVGGLILFIIPGLIFMAWFSLAPYAMVNEKLGAVASLKRSKELVKGRVWEMWALSWMPTIAALIPFVGGLLNFVLSIVLFPAMALRYIQLKATKSDNRPAVHWSNYAVIGVAALAIIASIGFAASNIKDVTNEINSSTYTY